MLVTQSCQLCAIPWTVAHQAPLTMGFPRQEYWSGLPCPSPGDLPDPGMESGSLTSPALAGRFFTSVPPGIFPDSSAGKESAWNVGDLGSVPRLTRSPGERRGYPLQYSGLENSMDCIVQGVPKSQDTSFSLT